MNEYVPELNNIHSQLNEAIQEQAAEVQTFYEEAQALRLAAQQTKPSVTKPSLRLNSALGQSASELPDKVQALKQARQAKQNYRVEHNLDREVVEPDSMITLLVLNLMGFFEGAVNAAFFVLSYMVGGPVAGLTLSMMISFTNIAVSSAAGFYIGRFRHYGRDAIAPDEPEFVAIRKRAGVLFILYLGLIGFFHLTVGLIRSTEELDLLNHSLQNYVQLLATPQALFLIMAGGVMSVLAYHKGLNGFDDPYPKYGDRHRAVVRANDELLDAYEDASEDIEAVTDAYYEEIEFAAQSQQVAVEAYNQKCAQCHAAKRELDQLTEHAQNQFATQARKIANTRSTLAGKQEAFTDELMQQFSFDKAYAVDLPVPMKVPNNHKGKAALEKDKAHALDALNHMFEQHLKD